MKTLKKLLAGTIALVTLIAFSPASAAIHFAFSSSQDITTTGYTPTGSISVVFWGYMDSLPSTHASDYWNGPNSNWIFGVESSTNKPSQIRYKSSTGAQVTGNNALSVNTWYLFQFTHNTATGEQAIHVWDTSFTLVSSAAATNTSGARDTGTSWGIGRQGGGGNYWDGAMRNMVVVNAVLTDAETITIGFSCNPLIEGVNTIAKFWPLVDGNDNREMVNLTTTTLNNTPANGIDPPTIPYRY
jgi:hypothetical protein